MTWTFLVIAVIAAYRFLAVYRIRTGCGSAYRPLIIEPPRQIPSTVKQSTSLVLMSYNTQGHAALIRGDQVEEVAETIRKLRPDVVGLQEVHRWTWQARFEDQARQLANLTGMTLIYYPSFTVFGGGYGNAILTRGKVLGAGAIPLPGWGEPRTLLDARIEIRGRRFRFFATHYSAWGSWTGDTRTQQVRCSAARATESREPFVLVGDLNVGPEAAEIIELQRLTGTRSGEPQPAATHRVTQERLDYILLSPQWQVVSARVVDDGPSDHLPVLAEVDLKGSDDARP
jgi:endonuclease/exonuclease/phosphatase family metal-dependent hydrolase